MAPASPPARLSRRFAIAAAILTAAAMLLISIVSLWLIDRQREHANDLLQQREVAFHATTVGRNLEALTSRLADVAASPNIPGCASAWPAASSARRCTRANCSGSTCCATRAPTARKAH